MANRFIRIERSVNVVLFVPHDEEHYPGLSLAEAIASEADRTEGEQLYFLITDANAGKGTLRRKVTAVTKEEMGREQRQ